MRGKKIRSSIQRSAKFLVMKALAGRNGEISFYEIELCNDSFTLERSSITLEDISLRNFPADNLEHDVTCIR